jgi:hypothetical protein
MASELRARLASLIGRGAPPPVDEDRREIEEMFAECRRSSLEYGWEDKTEPRFTLRELDPEPPLPRTKAEGKRYCRRCGAHKRLSSFDPDVDHCRAHGSRPPRASAA